MQFFLNKQGINADLVAETTRSASSKAEQAISAATPTVGAAATTLSTSTPQQLGQYALGLAGVYFLVSDFAPPSQADPEICTPQCPRLAMNGCCSGVMSLSMASLETIYQSQSIPASVRVRVCMQLLQLQHAPSRRAMQLNIIILSQRIICQGRPASHEAGGLESPIGCTQRCARSSWVAPMAMWIVVAAILPEAF